MARANPRPPAAKLAWDERAFAAALEPLTTEQVRRFYGVVADRAYQKDDEDARQATRRTQLELERREYAGDKSATIPTSEEVRDWAWEKKHGRRNPARRRVEIGSLWTLGGETFEVIGDPIPGNELRAIRWASGREGFIGKNWFRAGGAEPVAKCGCTPRPKTPPAIRENRGVTTVRTADGRPVVAASLARAAGRLAVGRWHVLRRGGAWNARVREAVRGRNFVYAVREASNPGTVLYVGEAHSAKWKRPKLVWEEIETVDVDDRGRPIPLCALPASSPERKRRAKTPQPSELRSWKTLLHHFQDPSDKFRDLAEWTWHRTGDLEVALWFLPDGRDYCDAKGKALDVEHAKTLRLRPLHTSISFQRAEAPF